MFAWDYTWLFLIPPLILAVFAQAKVRGAYARYSRVAASTRLTASEVAARLLAEAGARDIPVEKIPGQLSDHYDPRKKVLRLSEGVYGSNSLAALGIAAHEAGHALQHRSGYAPLALRNLIYPVANIGSFLAFPLFLAGFFFNQKGPSFLMDLGILLYAAAVVFTVVTLPVEFDASRRAMAALRDRGLLSGEELGGARKVLSAASLTYVASTAMAVMQLLRMFMLRGSRD